jgi:outer membrane protein TolC
MLFLMLCLQIDSVSLEEAINIAFSQSPSFYESKIALDQSRILFYQSLSNLLPTTSVSASYSKSEYSGVTTSGYSGSTSFSVPLFDVDVISSILIAGRQVKGTTIQHRANISNLILQLKTAYYSLINTQNLLESSEITIERAQENLKLVETKYELGSASRLEMLQAEVFYLRSLQDKTRAKTQKISAQEQLKSILGLRNDIYPTDTLAAPDSTEFPPLDSLISILQEINYNIQIAQELRNIAKLELVSSYLALLPKVSFFYGYSVSSDSLIFDFEYYRDNAVKNYGITVSFPIFEIKSVIFNYLNAKKDLQLKEFEKQRTILEVEKTLRTTYYTLREAYDNLHFASKSLEAASEAATIAKEQYALGVISFLDFLNAEEGLYEAKVSYTSALTDFYTQRANFSYVLGELTFSKEQ